MTDPTLYAALLPLAGSLIAVAAILLWRGPRRSAARDLMREAQGTVTFLFDGEALEDATPAALRLVPPHPDHLTDREALLQALGGPFPTLRAVLDGIAGDGAAQVRGTDGDWIDVEYWDGLVRLTLHGSAGKGWGGTLNPLAVSALEEELATLRGIAEDAPQLIWQSDPEGGVVWANRAYLDIDQLSRGGDDTTRIWPPSNLFPGLAAPAEAGDRDHRRISLRLPGMDEARWYDVTSVSRGGGSLHFAVDANAAVQAETAQRNFVQTLAKTFADLAIGLAIFDRQRRLVMFNPSLMDLTGLPVDFLATKPQIHAFLDRLREGRMLPEPRNYRNWREEIAALEAEAASGSYCELWTLPGGQSYRVTGRPHPDGAIAFLFEDITSEMSLTRRFRSQIETCHAVFDVMEEGVAVFSPTGTLTLANSAYEEVWPRRKGARDDDDDGIVPEASLLPVSETRLRDEIGRWRADCVPTEVWGDVAAALRGSGQRRAWTARVRRDDGRLMRCRVVPLSGGSTMVGFSFPAEEASLRPLLPSPESDAIAVRA